MKEKVTISVIIPCYNSALTITKCLYSVLNQSVKVDEVIVIDDGSSDDTKLIVQQLFQQATDGIRKVLLEQANQGPSVARNYGVRESRSSYISFLDSDDQWFDNKVSIERQFLKDHDEYAIIATKYLSAPIKYSGNITFDNLLYKNYFLTPCVVLKKSVFMECGGFDEGMHFAEDFFLWLKVINGRRGYLLDHYGGGSIENKKPFGEKGLSSNLRKMHTGVLLAYRYFLMKEAISTATYVKLLIWEQVKYVRRIVLTYR